MTAASARKITYLLCGAPRTGSTLLAEALLRTGVAGRPDEYFNPDDHSRQRWKQDIGAAPLDPDFLRRVVERATTPNGVCGIKLHWHHLALFRRLLRAQAKAKHGGDPTLAQLTDLRYIWLIRRNKVAQGISHYIASETKVWQVYKLAETAALPKKPPLEFNNTKIDFMVDLSAIFDLKWERYFRSNGITPLKIYYEDFADDYKATVQRVLTFIAAADPAIDIAEPSLLRMSSDLSVEWERRYRDLLLRRSALSRLWHRFALWVALMLT